jgi:glycosyltransferase involved in cell wall biosynthesis
MIPTATLVPREAAHEQTMLLRRVLLVAYHFPPQAGSSGNLRSLKYCRYLPENGWLPTVLSTHPRAYERTDQSQMEEIPPGVKVMRAFALDTQKHLSFRGRYFRCAALPDRWVSWCLGAIPAGLREIRKHGTEAILTTFPVTSAVLIGLMLHRITGLPWVADFRDSMTEDDYPRDALTRRVVRWLERQTVRHASRLIFTAPSTRNMYLQRYPELSPEKCVLIPNGYDEEDFLGLSPASGSAIAGSRQVRLLHLGLIYPQERNPLPFFQALARLKKERRIESSWFCVELRACGNEPAYREAVKKLEIEDIVRFLPPLPYHQALEDSTEADALLLLQGASCDHQIPAKAYEYLRLRKPILALTTRTGDTAALLYECGGATIADLSNVQAICDELPSFISSVRSGTHSLPRLDAISKYSRRTLTRELANCLSEVGSVNQTSSVITTANPRVSA